MDRQAALRARATTVLRDRIRPAQRDFATFMEREYAPAARKGLGIRTVPGGEAYYRFAVKDFTTTNLSPDEVYALGEKEVARIRAQMLVTMKEAGFTGDLACLHRHAAQGSEVLCDLAPATAGKGLRDRQADR